MNPQKLDYELDVLIKKLEFAKTNLVDLDQKIECSTLSILRFMEKCKKMDEVVECLK